jgi:hypothetical protein
MLRRALAIADSEMARLAADEPSPALAARIRQSVGEPSAAPALRFRWLWPVAAAAATVALAVAMWVGRPIPTHFDLPRVSSSPGAAGVSGAEVSVLPPTKTASLEAGRPEPPRSAGPATRTRVRGGSLATGRAGLARDDRREVLVPAGEGEALLRLVALTHRAGRTPAALLAAGEPSPDLAGPAPLDIEPIEIVPLDPGESSGTD